MQVTPPADDELARACRELNFKHSLVSEGHEMRALALDVLAQSARALDEVASSRLNLAAGRGAADHARMHDLASRARTHAARARELCAALEARPIDTPRPAVH